MHWKRDSACDELSGDLLHSTDRHCKEMSWTFALGRFRDFFKDASKLVS